MSAGDENAYDAITGAGGDARWAFGTGFADPLAGMDTAVPAGVDGAGLAALCAALADDALVMSHRLQQWLTRAPELEEETALANIALDLLGQARFLYSRAGAADGTGRSDDDFAFGRPEAEFRNVVLAEVADDDFAALVVRLLVFSAWRLAAFARLAGGDDPLLAAVAAKGVKELTYHRDWAARWVLTLGDGTDVSRLRVSAAVDAVSALLPELLGADAAAGDEAAAALAEVLAAAGLGPPAAPAAGATPGRHGTHSAAMAGLLEELQGTARSLPGASW
jgi:ring-1,2-phenylacetyl-CoA epoxidase subunit PaaC